MDLALSDFGNQPYLEQPVKDGGETEGHRHQNAIGNGLQSPGLALHQLMVGAIDENARDARQNRKPPALVKILDLVKRGHKKIPAQA
jgi:hypothetical protein